MISGYLVLNHTEHIGLSKKYVDRYMQIREDLFGYAQTYPERRTPKGINPVNGLPVIHLENGHLGLLETREQAEQLRPFLLKEFPNSQLEIIEVEYPDSTSLYWYRA